jgi:hypothetical protein
MIVANYVLIHGAGNDGSVWEKVIPLLQDQGHKVFCPTLSGTENTGLSDHILEICNLIKNEHIDKALLVGHSYAGMVITGVADRVPEKIVRLVYVDSVIPENGKSLFDMFHLSGVNPAEYGVQPDKPIIEPLHFDVMKIRKISKTYIHCKLTPFVELGLRFFNKIVEKAKEDHWDYFKLDAKHHCMISEPEELAEILLRKKRESSPG